jgi:lipoprotein NlpI
MVVAVLAFMAGCAVTPEVKTEKPQTPMPPGVAEINRMLTEETDSEKTAALLFERGHAWFDAAERKGTGLSVQGSAKVDYMTYVLNALKDFETVADEFPGSQAAPDALFHIGVIYDYPNLSSFGLAMQFYQRTVDEYPGTEPAVKAQTSISNIEKMVEQMMKSGHGQGQGI